MIQFVQFWSNQLLSLHWIGINQFTSKRGERGVLLHIPLSSHEIQNKGGYDWHQKSVVKTKEQFQTMFFYQSWSCTVKFCIKIDILISNFQFIRAYGFSLFAMKCPGTTLSVYISVCVWESFRRAMMEDHCLIILHNFTSWLLLYCLFLIALLWLYLKDLA